MPDGIRKRKNKRNKNSSPQDETPLTPKYSADDETDTDSPSKIKPKPPPPQSKLKKFCVRFLTTWIMLGALVLFFYIGHSALVLLVTFLQVAMFWEIYRLGMLKRKEKELPTMKFLHWWLLFCTMFFVYGLTLWDHFLSTPSSIFASSRLIAFCFEYHTFMTYVFFMMGFVFFVISLKKGFYKYQFKQLAWCIITSVVTMGIGSLGIVNIQSGIVWFIHPALIIVTNDCFAYLFGFFFGKTPLIELSPKKTWEGYMGGGFATIVMHFFLTWVWLKAEFFEPLRGKVLCPQKGFLNWDVTSCAFDGNFEPATYSLPAHFAGVARSMGVVTELTLEPFWWHGLMFAFFASTIGPFGGFFASGFKRAFEIKDFNNIIPGHGGVVDRMDCQVLMAAFVYVYRSAFARPTDLFSLRTVYHSALLLSTQDQQTLLGDLAERLGVTIPNG